MNRFNYDDDANDDFDLDRDDEEREEPQYDDVMQRQEHLEMLHLDSQESELNAKVMSQSLRLLEGSWWWPFKSRKKRMDELIDTFFMLRQLAQFRDEPEDDDA